MRLILLDDDGNPIGNGMMLKQSDFTYIKNGAADWLSLTVDSRQAVLSFIVGTFRDLTPQPIIERPPKPKSKSNVIKFRKV